MKIILQTAIAVFTLLSIGSCTKENIQPATTQANTNSITDVSAFSIGQSYGGGIIFYIDATGLHGYIAATSDVAYTHWWNGAITATGATGVGINAGAANTKKIIASLGTSVSYAAYLAANYAGGGFHDWFLPSKKQLYVIYKKRKFFTLDKNNSYWSSTESNSSYAWFMTPGDGGQFTAPKYADAWVRPVRAF